MNNLTKAKEILQNGGFTCVLLKDENEYTSDKRGVKPLLCWLESGEDFEGFSAADKVVGKAAAFLYVLLRVKAVYADVISEHALSVLKESEIKVAYGELVPAIRNRTNTGFCPMEAATLNITDPEDAVAAIKNVLVKLSK